MDEKSEQRINEIATCGHNYDGFYITSGRVLDTGLELTLTRIFLLLLMSPFELFKLVIVSKVSILSLIVNLLEHPA